MSLPTGSEDAASPSLGASAPAPPSSAYPILAATSGAFFKTQD
eukprot:CAMPEP_0184305466 /NCGR_PEP_ID=MMETSP1049-20130417/14743_1 /TAXON_ID=77928 /ORGANISM="Proteomonas sulcata, Strain CCMP704" /LENGTH=42 /DNA_ID= /DNA_START= /DNA_END= /DNA_ORIENTATION=